MDRTFLDLSAIYGEQSAAINEARQARIEAEKNLRKAIERHYTEQKRVHDAIVEHLNRVISEAPKNNLADLLVLFKWLTGVREVRFDKNTAVVFGSTLESVNSSADYVEDLSKSIGHLMNSIVHQMIEHLNAGPQYTDLEECRSDQEVVRHVTDKSRWRLEDYIEVKLEHAYRKKVTAFLTSKAVTMMQEMIREYGSLGRAPFSCIEALHHTGSFLTLPSYDRDKWSRDNEYWYWTDALCSADKLINQKKGMPFLPNLPRAYYNGATCLREGSLPERDMYVEYDCTTVYATFDLFGLDPKLERDNKTSNVKELRLHGKALKEVVVLKPVPGWGKPQKFTLEEDGLAYEYPKVIHVVLDMIPDGYQKADYLEMLTASPDKCDVVASGGTDLLLEGVCRECLHMKRDVVGELRDLMA